MPDPEKIPDQNLQVTSADEWRKPAVEGFIVELPSGKVARVRRTMDLFSLVQQGKVPNLLSGIVGDMLSKGKAEAPTLEELKVEELIEMLSFIDQCVIACMLEPKVAQHPPLQKDGELVLDKDNVPIPDPEWEPPAGFISTADVDMGDKMFLFTLAQGGSADAARFREEQDGVVRRVLDGEDLPVPSVEPSVNREQRRAAARKSGSKKAPAKRAAKRKSA